MQRLLLVGALLITACESRREMRAGDSVAAIYNAKQPEAPLAVNPCDRPRPYRKWTNEELNTAQVRYMGTPQSQGLMDEAACRVSGH